jgi:hypothetical protein
VVAGRVRIRDQDRRQPVLGELEHRAAGPRDGDVGGGEGGAERDHVVAQHVVRAGSLEVGEVAAAGDVQDPVGRIRERLDRRLVDRAGAERAAEHERRQLPRLEAELGAGGGAVGDRRRHRAAGEQVAVAVAALDREREADPARAGRQQAVGQTEVRVGLGEDERGAAQHRREADRAGDVAAAAEHGVGAVASQYACGSAERGDRLGDRSCGLDRVAARDALDVEAVDLVAGGGDELGLGALAAGEADVRALSP